MILNQNFFKEFEFYITPSDIIEFIYCKRFIYFMKCLGIEQYEEKRYKVEKGRTIHKDREKHNRDYLRKRIRTITKHISINLVSQRLMVRGKVDEIHLLDDDTMAPLDYKYAEYKDVVHSTYRTQIIMYALLIEETFGKSVNKGYIVYCRGGNRVVEVQITAEDKKKVLKTIEDYKKVINGIFPKPTIYKARCVDCCYKNICIM